MAKDGAGTKTWTDPGARNKTELKLWLNLGLYGTGDKTGAEYGAISIGYSWDWS